MKPKASKTILILSFLLILGVFFNIGIKQADAVSVEELKQQIVQLQAQIAALQQRLAQLTSNGEAWCHDFNANLRYGDSGAEVAALQTALEKQGFSIGGTEKTQQYFGDYTASAVVSFQEKYTSEILVPWKLQHGTGYVGSTTRTKLNELYGCFAKPSTDDFIATPTCTLTADPSSGQSPLSGTLTWATANNPTSCTASGPWSGSKNTSGGTENYGPLSAGIYTYTLTCSNSAGLGTCSVEINVSTSPSIPACSFLASPSSGTAPLSGKLTWNVSGNPSSCIASEDWSGSKNTGGGTENYGPLSDGIYIYTLACSNSAGTGTCSKTITAFSHPPSCALTANPISGSAPLSGTLSWSTTNKPTSCIASGNWSGPKNTDGEFENYGPLNVGIYTYTLTCSNSAGTDICSVTINVSAVSLDVEYIRPTNINLCFGSKIWGTAPGDKCSNKVAKAVDDPIGSPDYFVSYAYDIQASDYYEENSCHMDLEDIDSDAAIAKITVHIIGRATNSVDGAEIGIQLGLNCNRYTCCTDDHCTVISPSSWKLVTTNWSELTWDWDVNPATLNPWTKNDINNLSIGIMRHKIRYGMVNITQVYVTVHYGFSAPPGCTLIIEPNSGPAFLSGIITWKTINNPDSCITRRTMPLGIISPDPWGYLVEKNPAGGSETYGPFNSGSYFYTLGCTKTASCTLGTCSATITVSD